MSKAYWLISLFRVLQNKGVKTQEDYWKLDGKVSEIIYTPLKINVAKGELT